MKKWEKLEHKIVAEQGGVHHPDSGKGTHSLADGHDDTFVMEIKTSDTAVTVTESMLKKVRSKARLGARDWKIILDVAGQRYTIMSGATAKVLYPYTEDTPTQECKSLKVGTNFRPCSDFKIGEFEFVVIPE